MKRHHAHHDILHEHELWANKISTFITGIFGLTAVPVFLAIPMSLCFGEVCSPHRHPLATGLIVLSEGKQLV